MADQLDRTGIGPLEVVEGQNHRSISRKTGKQSAHRPVGAIALLRQLRQTIGGQCVKRRKHDGQLARQIARQDLKALGLEAHQPVVQRIAEHAERQLGLKLRCTPRQHEMTTSLGPLTQLPQETALADTRLAGKLQRQPTHATIQRIQQLRDRLQLTIATDQPLTPL